jgi:hypothetical protein
LGDFKVRFGHEGHYEVFIKALEGGDEIVDWVLRECVHQPGLAEIGFGYWAAYSGG